MDINCLKMWPSVALLARRHFRKSASVRLPGHFGLLHFSLPNPPPCNTFMRENGNNYDRKQRGKEINSPHISVPQQVYGFWFWFPLVLRINKFVPLWFTEKEASTQPSLLVTLLKWSKRRTEQVSSCCWVCFKECKKSSNSNSEM